MMTEYNFTISPIKRDINQSVVEYVKREIIQEIYNFILPDDIKKSYYQEYNTLVDEKILGNDTTKGSIVFHMFCQMRRLIVQTHENITVKVIMDEKGAEVSICCDISYENTTINALNINIVC